MEIREAAIFLFFSHLITNALIFSPQSAEEAAIKQVRGEKKKNLNVLPLSSMNKTPQGETAASFFMHLSGTAFILFSIIYEHLYPLLNKIHRKEDYKSFISLICLEALNTYRRPSLRN